MQQPASKTGNKNSFLKQKTIKSQLNQFLNNRAEKKS
jgi:hypothetical protein